MTIGGKYRKNLCDPVECLPEVAPKIEGEGGGKHNYIGGIFVPHTKTSNMLHAQCDLQHCIVPNTRIHASL